MSIQIKQIKGDIVELVFNPKEIDLRVGENLSLRENGGDRGLIVQIIEFRTVTYPSLLGEMLELLADDLPAGDGAVTAQNLADLPQERLPEISNLKLAIAKIRKVVEWSQPMAESQSLAPSV
jgi:hypothetical protein